jgi:eukaryotic-like serine/threonine-protein kinase
VGAPDVHASVVGKRFGAYVAVRPLAAGGMAELYLAARNAPGGRGVELGAIKRLLPHLSWDPEFVRMFLAEVRIVAGLVHPNIVRVVDYGTGDGGHYFAMEYVHGETLRSVLRDSARRPPPLPFAVGVVAELADGLHYAHEFVSNDGSVAGLVHRDVSPSNVMIAHSGAVKLLDFGIARISGATSHTRAGMVKGKVGYMSPEQCRGDRIDRRTDVFGLGILLYELSVGRRAFWAENDFAVVGKILCGEITTPSSIVPAYPPALEAIVRRALQVDPDDRYATTHEMAEDLRQVAISSGLDLHVHARATFMRALFGDVPWPRVDQAVVNAKPPARSRAPVRAAAIAGLVVAVGIGGYAAGYRTTTETEITPTEAPDPPPVREAAVATPPPPDTIASGDPIPALDEPIADTPTIEPPPSPEPDTKRDAGRRAKRKRATAATEPDRAPTPTVAADGTRLLPPSWQE